MREARDDAGRKRGVPSAGAWATMLALWLPPAKPGTVVEAASADGPRMESGVLTPGEGGMAGPAGPGMMPGMGPARRTGATDGRDRGPLTVD